MCGGTRISRCSVKCGSGLSPRVRGNHVVKPGALLNERSIPACAGEPYHSGNESASKGVYPRVCGGTNMLEGIGNYIKGLSPRVRGNQGRHHGKPEPLRSIPACAGEPLLFMSLYQPETVYPRVCGGTPFCAGVGAGVSGLSPRVRGNPPASASQLARIGSIPACAGEPPSHRRPGRDSKVYPRVCGGTPYEITVVAVWEGLSPRVRGNRRKIKHRGTGPGSIPACAGEPSSIGSSSNSGTVYPRVCGGTAAAPAGFDVPKGLSPRVRGNRDDNGPQTIRWGSIPACAGEPPPRQTTTLWLQVYPRVCGGTIRRRTKGRSTRGLSPRVRGNRREARMEVPDRRSIPACAGEPPRAAS